MTIVRVIIVIIIMTMTMSDRITSICIMFININRIMELMMITVIINLVSVMYLCYTQI